MNTFKKYWKEKVSFKKSGTAKYFVNFDGMYTMRYYDEIGNFLASETFSPVELQYKVQNAQMQGYRTFPSESKLLELLGEGLNPELAGEGTFEID